MKKYIFILLAILTLSACGGGGDDASSNSQTSQPPATPIDNKVYPYEDKINFNSEYLGSVITLSDSSMWQITGVSQTSSVGSGVLDFRIYSGTTGMSEAKYGTKSNYYMLVAGNSTTYFVTPLLSEKLVSSSVSFNSEYLGSVITLSDSSMWQITGVSQTSSVGSGVLDFKIYSGTTGMSEAKYGTKTNYYMLVSGSSTTYSVTPLLSQKLVNGSVNFNSEYLGSVITLSDSSMWQITGVSQTSSVGSGVLDFRIYSGTTGMSEAKYGKKTNYYMLVAGNSTTYFVTPL